MTAPSNATLGRTQTRKTGNGIAGTDVTTTEKENGRTTAGEGETGETRGEGRRPEKGNGTAAGETKTIEKEDIAVENLIRTETGGGRATGKMAKREKEDIAVEKVITMEDGTIVGRRAKREKDGTRKEMEIGRGGRGTAKKQIDGTAGGKEELVVAVVGGTTNTKVEEDLITMDRERQKEETRGTGAIKEAETTMVGVAFTTVVVTTTEEEEEEGITIRKTQEETGNRTRSSGTMNQLPQKQQV